VSRELKGLCVRRLRLYHCDADIMRWIVVGEIHKYCMWFDENVEVLVKKFVVGC